jgi:hypothetical protein
MQIVSDNFHKFFIFIKDREISKVSRIKDYTKSNIRIVIIEKRINDLEKQNQ